MLNHKEKFHIPIMKGKVHKSEQIDWKLSL